mmetsp:Transcript_48255/g.151053  ORF Transcript_48255/g.151053 Transcript_48255/m.151053 type:complete len:317 (-) Transcript_48255:390-1340(-)
MHTATASSSPRTSQMPSQARMRKRSSVGCRSYVWISGTAVTSSPVAPAQPYRCGSFMRRSPKARETARPHSTFLPPNVAGPGVKTRQTPCMSTTPPFASIRRRSSALPGLWSSDKRTAERRPFWERQSTARESPRLAMRSLQCPVVRDPSRLIRASSGKMRQRSMVDPSSTSRSLAFARNSSSVSTHASVTAWRRCSSVSAGFAERHFWRFLGSHSTRASTQRLPEWPSKTTKPTTRLPSGASNSTLTMYRSSCTSLFPCQDAAPTETISRPTAVSWTSDSFMCAEGSPAPAAPSATCWWRLASSFSCAWPYSPRA